SPGFGLNAYRSGTNWNCDVYPVSGNETDAAVTFEASGSYYKIRLTNYSGRYLTAGGTGDGANVYWAAATGANNQLWNLVKITGLRCPLDSYVNVTQSYSSGHLGVDFAATQYTPIKAAKAGKVIYVQNYNNCPAAWASMGHCVYVQHSDGLTIYMHMNEYPSSYVYVGKTVSKGDTIGRVGTSGNSTGYHLHFAHKRGTSFTYNSANAYNEGTWANPLNYVE
ncbi:MAG: peptidoglycan DD-metalloendopeptidase family protein, partial [Candidatus Avispirillum sp.]